MTTEKPAAKQTFLANKDQLIMAQKILEVEPTGKTDPATRTAIAAFQKEKELKQTGALDRETMQKLGIGLTTAQRELLISPAGKTGPTTAAAAKPNAFRATREQIIQVQKLLKQSGFYSGDATGVINAETGDGLKKYQTANDLEATGTVNQITLEKMDIPVTDQQRESVNPGSE
ncbi:MAG: peptidoglycan-binding protein [Acidobacteriota bacterium]|nr:peptidoglycan-binding protein [Acidobacteriota bacterium]